MKPCIKLNTRKFRYGFTLIELLVVIAILGVLAAVGLATFNTSQMRGRDAQRKSDLKQISNALNDLRRRGASLLMITHYNRILKYVKPDFVHIMKDGKIIRSGGHRLANNIEQNGYETA